MSAAGPRHARTGVYDSKPWLARYAPGLPIHIEPEYTDALEMFRATVAHDPDADIIRYFDGRLTRRELDEQSDAFAAALTAHGFRPGERAALFLQNVPQFVVAQLGVWKAGGIPVSVNPMNKERELGEILLDSGATVLVALQGLYRDVAQHVVAGTAVRIVITTSELEYQTRGDERIFSGIERLDLPDTLDLQTLLAEFRGRPVPVHTLGPDDIAFLTYTSGTTGPPKGAMTTHRNVVFNARTYREWVGLGADDVVLGIAPLFHITGLVGHIAVALLTGAPLVLMYRLDPGVTLETVAVERATFTVGSITVFIALMNAPGARGESLKTLTKIFSGGAPIPPSTVAAFERFSGTYIHNIYGLTETTSPSHAVPFGTRAPVDEASGALSVGVPTFDTVVRIVDEDGNDLPSVRWASSSRRARRWSPATGTSPRRPRPHCPGVPSTPGTSGTWTPTAGSTSSTARRTRSTPVGTRSGRERSRTCSTSTKRCARPRWWGWWTATAARRSRRSSASVRGIRSPRRN
ncbi:2-succinylbenzoate--CoA ligase [Rhodococcus sp. YH1]|nr:2-succinylbenzoate--CoA ligase [Rhodococcus sp. YH1]